MKTITCTLAAAIAIAAAGCSEGGGSQSDDQGGSSSVPSPFEDTSTDTGTDTAPPAPEGEPAPQEPSRVLAGRDGQIDGQAVRLDIIDLRRSGATAALTFQLSMPDAMDDSSGSGLGAQVGQTFDDGVATGESPDALSTLDGVSLIDTKNAKRHLAGRDASGLCVCDANLNGVFVEAAAPVALSATFAAPPPDVQQMDVVIPRFGTFKDVPLQ